MALVCAGTAPTQDRTTTVPAPRELAAAFDATAAQVQDLVLPASSDRSFEVRVAIDGVQRVLELHPHDVRTPDVALLVDDGTSIREVPAPPSVTFRGWIAGDRDSRVAASLIDGQLSAMVLRDDEVWEIAPASAAMPGLPRSAHVVFSTADAIPRGMTCGTVDGALGMAGATGGVAGVVEEPDSTGATNQAEIAIDCDFNMFQRRGSSIPNVQNTVTTIMNGVGVIYARDVDCDFLITNVMVRIQPTYSSTTTGLLSEFRNRWNSQHTGIQRDLAHLFSGKNNPGSTIGVATRGALCSRSTAYGVSWVLYTSSNTRRIALVAHEIGHTFNAGHCNGSSECHIMCDVIGRCGVLTRFAPVTINVIRNFINRRSCVRPPPPPIIPTLTSVTPSTTNSRTPGLITVTGTDLNSVTNLTLSGTPVANFTVVDPTTITFRLPGAYEIATHPLVASNAQGVSNALTLDITGTHPAALVTPFAHVGGITAEYTVWTDRGWKGLYFVSPSITPSPLPGVVNFGIGNNFTELVFLLERTADNGGYMKLDVTAPIITSATALFWQVLVFDPAQFPPALPLEVSNVSAVTFL